MAFAINSRRSVTALIAVASTAVLFWFGNGLDPWWPLLWFAPLPLLIFASRNSWGSTALTTILSLLIGCLSMWHYFAVLHSPPAVWIITYTIVALLFALAVLLFRALLLRGASWSALLAFPAAWVSCEFAANFLTPHGTGASLSYSQLDFLPFLQLASITGPWGMSFLLMLFPAAIAIGLYLRHSAPKQAWRIVGTTLGVIVLVLIFGEIRLAAPASSLQTKVGLIASDTSANVRTTPAGTPTKRLFQDYATTADTLAAQGAKVIVMPEKVGTLAGSENQDTDAIFQSVADKTGATIVVGLLHDSPPLQYNQAQVYMPQTTLLSYNKHHLLPPFESAQTPGTTLTVMQKSAGNWGVAICKDMDFTQLSRQYGNAGVGLMLVPGWDFVVDRSWHGHKAIMRGVESGFSIVHAAKDGYLTVSDSRGRILAQTLSDSAPFATLIAEAPTVHEPTLFLLLGDWFAWVALAILAFTLLRLWLVRKNAHS
jgi:apolipoprotein N-acyltransferase